MEFEKVLARIALVLTELNIPYMIIGGQAVLVHGEPRLTRDIDVTLGIPPFDPGPLLTICKNLGVKLLVDNPKEFLEQTFVLPALDENSGIRVDLICSISDYETEAISRASLVKIGDSQISFISASDLVIHKVIAGRARDLEDVRSVLLKNPKIDRNFVKTWLVAHDKELETDFEERFEQILISIE